MLCALRAPAFLTIIFIVATLAAGESTVWKRDYPLPYDTLPESACAVPSACSNIQSPAVCRCNSVVTVCHNDAGQFCWGSETLNATSNCPAIPEPCNSEFNSTQSCLCNDSAVLCVDSYDHYCYATAVTTGSSGVSLAAIPTSAIASSSISSSSTSSSSSSTSGTLAASYTAAATAEHTSHPIMLFTAFLAFVVLYIIA
ncbi:hypothetical protein BCR43DRAFT_487754 [Syncephalastrum racemosum]|uniref:Extracellular membrane protein CFEM domain-containing protein n=1 Tax=Syncephalastrum racemosum TaxID=13706 RepID=A0A1X2HHN3_SYNRA|nr:hypothetical protein BCR43DRAFT_487754 [Syncephalastrum racemosum]